MTKWRCWYPNKAVVVEARTALGAEVIASEQWGAWPTFIEKVYPDAS